MKCKIEIKMDNAAFDDDRDGELWRILTDLGTGIFKHGLGNMIDKPIMDVNGNTVGKITAV